MIYWGKRIPSRKKLTPNHPTGQERTMMLTKIRLVQLAVLAFSILALAACRPVTREGAAAANGGAGEGAAAMEQHALAGTGWTLTALNGAPVPAEPVVTLNLSGTGQATGTDGCNRYVTAYTVEGDAITFSPAGASTMMACPDPIMAQAQAYMAALTAAATFTAEGDTLTLLDGSGTAVAVFTAVSTDLAGTAWTATMINNGREAVVSVIEGTTVTAEFGADGVLGGSGGCNSFSAGYQSDGEGQITIDPPASTMMACAEPAGVMEQEMQYLAALTTAATYTVEGNRLELRTADGALAVSFQQGVAQAAAAEGGTAAVDAAAGTAGMTAVTGAIVYLPRIALPPDALVTVTIHNAQLADAPPEMTTLATTAFTTGGAQVPLPYELFYTVEDVRESDLYSIGATIRSSAGDLLFVSKEAIPVITRGNPTENVEILVSQP
jgi:heat shock protein HslJ